MNPIIGYRGWQFLNGVLYSLYKNCISGEHQYWIPGVLFKANGALDYDNGIHAFKSIKYFNKSYGEFLYWNATNMSALIHGEVALWGKIVEHELGYRAEFAYPKKLYVNKLLRNSKQIFYTLKNKYGCEVEYV